MRGRAEDLLGSAVGASQGAIGAEDLEDLPLLRRGELLEAVPGMVVTQHWGDGKANQYFLRGFNLDHGTDFAFSVDGVPVNLPSHAHGQGYADLNFLIPLPSLRRHEAGMVLLNVVVQPNGIPAAITLNKSCGHPLLDRAALEAVHGWTFEPARAAGLPVSSLVVVPVRFSLSEGP